MLSGSRTRGSVLLLAVAVLAGCALLPVADDTAPDVAPTLLPTPVPTQARETGLVAPARPFGGDCGALMSESEADALLGGDAELSTSAPDPGYGPRVTVELHGGMRCAWSSEAPSIGIFVVLLPADAANYAPPSACTGDDGDFRPSCAVEDVVNGTRVSGSVAADSVEIAEGVTTAFLALFEDRANATPPAPVPVPALGAWVLPVNCAAVVAAGDFSTVPGLGATSTGDGVLGNDFERLFSDGERALEGPTGVPICEIYGSDATVDFVASGGGRWLESTVATVATSFAIEGYESAYVSGDGEIKQVDVFDGPNWLHFTIRHISNAKALADALFAALNTFAAS